MLLSENKIIEISSDFHCAGDFVVSQILDDELIAYPVVLPEFASDYDKIYGIKANSPSYFGTFFIKVLQPERFKVSEVSAIMGELECDSIMTLNKYKNQKFIRKRKVA